MDQLGWFIVLFLTIFCAFILYRYLRLNWALKRLSRDLETALLEQSHSEFRRITSERSYQDLLRACNKLRAETLRQAKSVQESQSEVEQTISNLAHDLRTPLTGAKGYLELLIDEAQQSQADIEQGEELELLLLVQKRLEVLAELLEQLFAYTKSRDESLLLKPEVFELNEFIREIFLRCYPDFEQRQLELELALSSEPIYLAEDLQALEQIFSNLIQNALRYAKSEFCLSCAEHEDFISIKASNDLKEKLAQSQLKTLTQRYKRGAWHRPEGASGLGLAIIESYLQRMNGELKISSSEKEFILEIILKK
ncbi:MAG: HAMP domain-containing sensor histidine kinase [Eubacteriales bacterium]|nr:HAMP domain-containing sensor histidine kinase [Eubacteriales bacterium]